MSRTACVHNVMVLLFDSRKAISSITISKGFLMFRWPLCQKEVDLGSCVPELLPARRCYFFWTQARRYQKPSVRPVGLRGAVLMLNAFSRLHGGQRRTFPGIRGLSLMKCDVHGDNSHSDEDATYKTDFRKHGNHLLPDTFL